MLHRWNTENGDKVWVWKVPAREVYCDTFRSWLHMTIWCYIVLPYFRGELDLYAQAAVDRATGASYGEPTE
jgi:hypothetical protein